MASAARGPRKGPFVTAVPGLRTPPDPLPGSKYSKWRALTLALVYPLMAVHVIHWKLAGKTLAPLELHEVMFTAELGIITAGFLLMLAVTIATLLFGRFFCSWGCHIMVLQDGAAWVLRRLGLKVRPIRSRMLLAVPPLVLVYMFGWPQITRMWAARDFPELRTQTDLEGISSWVTTNFWRNLPDPWITALTFAVCGFLVVYVLGSRGFCTYGCPYGALFLTVDRFAPGRIRVNDRCVQCGTCTAVCTSGVRVHEEIREHGTIVNPRCLKDLDCVGACPEHALEYKWGAPAIRRLWSDRAVLVTAVVLIASILVAVLVPAARHWLGGRFDLVPFGLAVVALGLAAYGRTGMPARPAQFTTGEEILMGVVFLATLVVYRQLYDAVPFLLTIGLGASAAYAIVVVVRLAARRDVRALERMLKVDGRLKPAGMVYGGALLVFLAFSVHSGFVQWHTTRGYAAFDASRAVADGARAATLREVARAHLQWSEEWGLFRSRRLLATLAATHLESADPARAVPYLARVVAKDGKDPEARVELGRALVRLGRPGEARPHLETALAVRTTPAGAARLAGWHAQAHYALAAAAALEGDAASAERSLREALALSPAWTEAHFELGSLLLDRGAAAEAEEHFRAAVQGNDAFAHAHYNLALALLAQSRTDEAARAAERARELAPGDAQIAALVQHLRGGGRAD